MRARIRPRAPPDHPFAARHRPVQVHDDAGGAASLPGCAGRVPLSLPQWRRRPDAAHRRDPRRDPLAVPPALHARRARVPARLALLQERLRRPAGALPARRAIHRRRARRRQRDGNRHRDPRAVAAHDPVRGAGAGDRQRGVPAQPPSGPRPRARPRAPRGEGGADQRGAGPGIPHRRLRHAAAVLAGLAGRSAADPEAGHRAEVRRHQQRAVRDGARADAAGHDGARIPAGLPGATSISSSASCSTACGTIPETRSRGARS